MSETLARQPWMIHPATVAVMEALAAAGGPDCARFVGGCVRNALIGAPVGDIDIATVLTPPQVKAALAAAGIASVATGEAHGTITAISDHRPFEITTLRRDVETDGRHAVVAFTDDWSQDAARRDFRLNALYVDAEGRLFDPTGHGLADARGGAVVFVGDPVSRIREDALRILRFFRFYAWYGRGEPDAAALAACRKLTDLVANLSAERVAHELLALLAADDPRPAVRLMAEAGVLPVAAPGATDLARFERLTAIETDVLFEGDPLLRLAALLPDDPAVAGALAERLRLSNAQKARLIAAAASDPAIVSWMSPRTVRQCVYRSGAEAFCDKAMLAWAKVAGKAAAAQWRALLPMARSWPRPALPLTGEEVLAAGVPRGPLVGKVLAEVESWWVDNDFPTDKLSVIERLKAVAQGMAY
ncbi:MAG TPA: CCA tRNA nucleotidyltransferase [Caulobacteraceae bacterium]|jgi:poly(A) polymerase